MSMIFAMFFLGCIWMAGRFIPNILHQHHASLSHVVLAVSVFPVLAVIYSVAWWTVWKEKRSARAWGIAASLTIVLINLWLIFRVIFHSSRSLRWCVWDALAIGVAGLVAFSWRDELHDPGQQPTEFADYESGGSSV
jgi:drug/metabolite transporter (DMT)-like permease